MSNPVLNEVGDIFKKAKAEAEAVITKAPEYGALGLYITHQFEQIINRVAFLGGTPLTNNTTKDFPPITNFMGEEIHVAKAVTDADINPDELEAANYNSKVEAGYNVFLDRDQSKILNEHTIPEDELVLRGIAKKAGVLDYETHALNNDFLAKIRDGINKNTEDAKARKDFEKNLKKETTGEDKTKKLTPEELEQKLKGLPAPSTSTPPPNLEALK